MSGMEKLEKELSFPFEKDIFRRTVFMATKERGLGIYSEALS